MKLSEHRRDDVDSLPPPGYRLGVGAEQVLCLPRGIAVRLLGHGLRQRIQEGVDKALRGIVLRVLPDVEEGGIRLHHAVIEICIAVPELPCTEAQQHDEHQRQNAEPPALLRHAAARPAVQDDRPGGDEAMPAKNISGKCRVYCPMMPAPSPMVRKSSATNGSPRSVTLK